MPRKPKNNHPLRDLRRIIGPHATQEWMAGVLGIAPITLTKIENGDRLKLTEEQKFCLASRFAVHPSSFESPSSSLIDISGRPYSADSITITERASKELNQWDTACLGMTDGIWLSGLFHAAAQRRRVMEVKMGFDSWLASTIDRLNLGSEFAESMRALTREQFKWEATVGAMAVYTDTAKAIRFPKTFKWRKESPVKIEGEQWIELIPRASHMMRDTPEDREPGIKFDDDTEPVPAPVAAKVVFEGVNRVLSGKVTVERDEWEFTLRVPFYSTRDIWFESERLRGIKMFSLADREYRPDPEPHESGVLAEAMEKFTPSRLSELFVRGMKVPKVEPDSKPKTTRKKSPARAGRKA